MCDLYLFGPMGVILVILVTLYLYYCGGMVALHWSQDQESLNDHSQFKVNHGRVEDFS